MRLGILALAITASCALAIGPTAQAQAPAPAKIAIIAIDALTGWEGFVASPGIAYEKMYLSRSGYQWHVIAGTPQNIEAALLDPRVRAISFFGHGGTADQKPTLAGVSASQWGTRMRLTYLRQFLAAGYQMDDASRAADTKAANFGLELMRNNSCHSLADTSIANLFVRPGGWYYGVRQYFSPCPTLQSLVSSAADATLTAYQVGVQRLAPSPMPAPPPPPPPPTIDLSTLRCVGGPLSREALAQRLAETKQAYEALLSQRGPNAFETIEAQKQWLCNVKRWREAGY